MSDKKNYNKQYFIERNLLDPRLAESIKILMNENNLRTVLDVGCGTGKLVEYLKKCGFEAIGCDKELQAVITSKKMNNIRVVHGSATKLPFKNNSFDIITSISVIEHLTPREVEKFIAESKRVLKPNGYIFIVTPNYATPIRLIQKEKWFGYSDPTHINFYTPKSFAKILKKFKFVNIKTNFKTNYTLLFDWDLPGFFRFLPRLLVYFLIYILYSTPFANIRNSFWIAAQKKD